MTVWFLEVAYLAVAKYCRSILIFIVFSNFLLWKLLNYLMKIRILFLEQTNCDLCSAEECRSLFFLIATTISKSFSCHSPVLELHYKSYVFFQNYTLRKLEKHTNYIVTVAARNYVGLGPSAVIELRTEDGGKHIHNVSFI